ncbi:MAG TPA: hypothetical protein VGB17_06680 [Pyrinomonadaceae bacterium]|jgi:hypothetical protein
MTLRQRKAYKSIALFLAFAVAQIFVQATIAGPTQPSKTLAPFPQAITARLTTRGNQSILVNGNNVSTGATILTGATIETGDQVGATINLGPLGSLDLAPNTKVVLEYDENGNVKVKVIQGCAILTTKKGAHGQVDTEQGKAGETEEKKGGILDICFPPGAANPVVNAGAAANAGAGAGGGAGAGAAGAGAGAGAGEGLGTAAWVAIIAGGTAAAIGIPLAFSRGDNPSDSTP